MRVRDSRARRTAITQSHVDAAPISALLQTWQSSPDGIMACRVWSTSCEHHAALDAQLLEARDGRAVSQAIVPERYFLLPANGSIRLVVFFSPSLSSFAPFSLKPSYRFLIVPRNRYSLLTKEKTFVQ